MDQLKLAEFDLYGTFRLHKAETKGIENLVQRLGRDEFLSRNGNYYPYLHIKTFHFSEICREYAHLNSLLPMSGKRAFVVCEKMHELAVRVVNAIQQVHQIHLYQDGQHFDTVAQKCVQECADNLVRLFQGQPAVKTVTKLRDETRLPGYTELKQSLVEADNKLQLYLCANALPADTEHLLTPGRGSAKLGALVQSVRRAKGLKPLGFTQVYYSHYSNVHTGPIFPKPLKQLPEKVLVMDDIIFKGQTLTKIKKELSQFGHQVTNGAVTATFYRNDFDATQQVFAEDDWAHYIDIIPNQYGEILEQYNLASVLRYADTDRIKRAVDKFRPQNQKQTAVHLAMRTAERKARALGANLYHTSAKVSPTAVAYNEKIRAQVKTASREFSLCCSHRL